MALNFPNSPVNGTKYTAPTGVEYLYDGEKWITVGSQNAIVDLPATYVAVAGDTMTGGLTVPSLNGGPLAGFRNQIINGDFRVNQRSGTRTPGVGVYGFDRWKGHAGGLEQIVEALPAGQWTLSWSGGGNGTFGGTTAASPITATVAGGDTSVVVPSTATNVQLEPGSVATPFEHRPIGTELALCQRYYQRISNGGDSAALAAGHMYGTATFIGLVSYPTKMRAAPSISMSSNAGDTIKILSAALKDGTSFTPQTISVDSCELSIEVSPSGTAGYGAIARVKPDQFVQFEAEL